MQGMLVFCGGNAKHACYCGGNIKHTSLCSVNAQHACFLHCFCSENAKHAFFCYKDYKACLFSAIKITKHACFLLKKLQSMPVVCLKNDKACEFFAAAIQSMFFAAEIHSMLVFCCGL
jgi:hypothetical protein